MRPRIALLTIGDGRDELLAATLASFEHATGWRPTDFAHHEHVDDREHQLGFCGAIQAGWRALREARGAFDYVFHLEEDFAFHHPVSLQDFASLLDLKPSIAQIALRRAPVNEYEEQHSKGTGDITMMWPELYTPKTLTLGDGRLIEYLEHAVNWTTNPSLYRTRLIYRALGPQGHTRGWPDAPRCEEAYGEALIAQGYRFAYAGHHGPAWITHTGTERTGTGY